MSQDHLNKRGRIAIFYPSPSLGSFQPLLDASGLLADCGYFVEIYTLSHPYHPRPTTNHPGIVINTECSEIFIDGGVKLPKLVYGRDGKFIQWGGRLFHWGGRLFHWYVTNFYRPLSRHGFISIFRRKHEVLPYVCFIGMNRYGEGLVESASYAEKLNIPLINWSLELSFMAEQKTEKQRGLKRREISCSQKAIFTIIQDKWRAQALAQENEIALSKMILVPNAPRGIARRRLDNGYRERLGIPSDKKVILCVGGIGYHNMNLEIVEAANNFPINWILVMQFKGRPSPRNDYSDQVVRNANPEKVKVLSEPVPMENYRELVDSADVGIAFYRACSPDSPETYMKNLDIIGLSSGKIADYLYSGLPVIVNNVTGPKELIASNQCGKWVNDTTEIENVLENIFQNYNFYSNNACRCFNTQLELSRNFLPVIERISSFNAVEESV